jgi:hypothetical protein
MRPLEVDIWYTIVSFLPKKLIYFCAMSVLRHGITGKYDKTNVVNIRAMTAIKRYGEDFDI